VSVGVGSVGRVSNVLKVDSLSHNLLSVVQSLDTGVIDSVVFKKTECTFLDAKGNTVASASRVGNLYVYRENVSISPYEANVVTSDDLMVHRRLCHINGESDVKIVDCEDCLKAKFTRLPYYESSTPRAEPGLRLFGDLQGKFPESFGGKVYSFPLLDDGSDLIIPTFLKLKSEALFRKQFDIPNAFTRASIDRDVFIRLPYPFDKVVKLKKALYGLKDSPRLWNSAFSSFLKFLGYESYKLQPCFFFKRVNGVIVSLLLLYVDDLLGSFLDKKMEEEFCIQLDRKFSVRIENGLDFLGIGIEDHGNYVYLDQKAFTMNLLEKFGMKDCNPTMMPYVSGLNLKRSTTNNLPDFPFLSCIGSLLYLVQGIRFEISSFAVILHPFNEDLIIPSEHYLSSLDCFHPSTLAHKNFAIATWNSLFVPFANKTNSWDFKTPVYCPTENDYIRLD
jgi:hypothetical protein